MIMGAGITVKIDDRDPPGMPRTTQSDHIGELIMTAPPAPPARGRMVHRAEPTREELGGPAALPDMIEQAGGRSFSQGATRRLKTGGSANGEAAELRQHLWNLETSGSAGNRLNGLQAAAFVATRDAVLAGKVRRTISYRCASYHGVETEFVHIDHVVGALRHDIAHNHCGCGEPSDCLCLDHALGWLNQAVRSGRLIDIGEQSREPITIETAWRRSFARRDIELLLLASDIPGNGEDALAAPTQSAVTRAPAASTLTLPLPPVTSAKGDKRTEQAQRLGSAR